jgi:hypothetical protein
LAKRAWAHAAAPAAPGPGSSPAGPAAPRRLRTLAGILLACGFNACEAPGPSPAPSRVALPGPAVPASPVATPPDPAPSSAAGSRVAAGAPAGWLATVTERVSASAYAIRPVENDPGRLHAENAAAALRATWDTDGSVRVEPGGDAGLPFSFTLRVAEEAAGDAAGGDAFSLDGCRGDGALDADGQCLRRAVARRPSLTEWWENGPRGLEQGFVAEEPIGGRRDGDVGPQFDPDLDTHNISIFLDILGATVEVLPGARDVRLRAFGLGPALRYGGLSAEDSAGSPLPAWFEASPGGLLIQVATDSATRWPVLVDPVLSRDEWSVEGGQASAQYGVSLGGAGDVDNDGYDDAIVGAWLWDNGEADEGKAWVYHGSASGLSSTPAWSAESNQAGARLGHQVDGAGDVNGDGYDDVIVGIYLWSNGQTQEGAARVYLGSATGLSPTHAWHVEGESASAMLGIDVDGAGDVDGDGFDDVVVGAWGWDNGQTDEGRALLYEGSASGLATTPAWTFESNVASALLGYAVAGAGDVDGDNLDDVVVGAHGYDISSATDEGKAWLFLGTTATLAGTAAWSMESNQTGGVLGTRVSDAGDVNGDGLGDWAVGGWNYDNGQTDEGQVWVFHGSASSLASATAAWTGQGDQTSAVYGHGIGSAGDVNADGYDDFLVGAGYYDNGQVDEGRGFLYLGSASGLDPSAAWTVESNQVSALMSHQVSGIGDCDGDGFDDFLVGAIYWDGALVDEGRAWLYMGSSLLPSNAATWRGESNQAGAGFGVSVAGAGDVDADGFSDLLVGAYAWDGPLSNEGKAFLFFGSNSGPSTIADWSAEGDQAGAHFGRLVSTAGDVNGDGFADILVGADGFDNGETDEGRASLYLGGSAGPASTAAWTAESNQASAYFGFAADSAGDVDGDGFGDVVVGAWGWDNGAADEGGAWLYEGSPGGLSSTAAWHWEPDLGDSFYGYALAGAGDVNGDSYSDVVVGAYAAETAATTDD